MHRLLCSILLVAAAGVADGEAHAVKLSREREAGERYAVTYRGGIKRNIVVTVAGRVVHREEEDVKIHLEGVVLVEKADDKGLVRFTCFVRRASVLVNGKETCPLAAGDRYTGERAGDDTEFWMDGAPASEELSKALDFFMDADPTEMNNDATYGTKAPRRVGEAWEPDAKNVAKRLEEAKVIADPANVTAVARLEETVKRWKQDCLVVSIRTNARDVKFDPDSKAVGQGDFAVEETVTVGLDPALKHRHAKEMVKTKLRFEGNGRVAEISIDGGGTTEWIKLGK